ncbi:hypothetical protein CNMCM6936_001598 [Aspergillus lentulus]|uniref:Uncharacterized protein n=2 Tax=Aspergillus lentulus TaxID=293939 RepID=A0ABQ1AS47_ASPLE|nr:hypothetical protein CNMCM6936_001598 [Aspergillus lentulus]GFF48529.1 hypothetical protein IFM62136_01046 [Aspergillus lentulus]GFF82656.1 hypothetical protein IFM47457_05880 [Aspergillus lentulus]GFF87055.1 hypothetical protein IFM60648_07912 [Aspergillus lentulus]
MAYRQHGLSRTLPKNFTFYSAGTEEPRTPERASIHVDGPPPPPRHSSCRLRRSRIRSGTDLFAQAEYDRTTLTANPSDIPLPSIELPPSHDASIAQSYPGSIAKDDRFLAPPRDRMALKTPPAQIRGSPSEPNDGWSSWDSQAIGQSLQRPGSACSQASDSSISSCETLSSRRSVGGSCTSAESDSYDPFFYLEIPPKQMAEKPSVPTANHKRTNRGFPKRERWTLDMDNHLWNTYQLYIQDPTITPFKMTPGSIPPLGVTHRVAREAKRSWERKRYRLARPFTSSIHQPQQPQSGETTPTPRTESPKTTWPKTEASTRRRLKLLCKRKFSIAPHYQRLMQSRSPTPFLDLFSRPSHEEHPLDSPGNSSTTYATRDLGVSLVSSSVPGPLSQLAAEHHSPQTTAYDWPPSQAVPCAPQTSCARPIAKTTQLHAEHPGSTPRLGSPFTYHTWGPTNSRKRTSRHTPRTRRETIHVTGSRLCSPPRTEVLPATDDSNIVYSVPRPAEVSSDHETEDHLETLIRDGKLSDIGNRRLRIRNRGATTSSITPQNLDQFFSPPSSASRNEETTPVEKALPNPLLDLSGENLKRLGSPFKVDASKRHEGRRIRHVPSLSDPFASGLLPQIRPVNRGAPSKDQQNMTCALPYDPTEKGISDAERIRRQILNMSYSRRQC